MSFVNYCCRTVILAFVLVSQGSISADAAPTSSTTCSPTPLGPVKNTQSLAGAAFIGEGTKAKPIQAPVKFPPLISGVHQDGGNTNSLEYPAPLGHNVSLSSVNTQFDIILWDEEGRLTAAYQTDCGNTSIFSVAIADPESLEILASWTPPASNDSLNFPYMNLVKETDQIVVSSIEGQINVLQRTQNEKETSIKQTRLINFAGTDVLKNTTLLNSQFDVDGNMWFSTGAILGLGQKAQPLTVVGYVEPNGNIHSMTIPNQMPENGMALNNDTVFLITGPTFDDDHADAVGYMTALRTGPGNSVTVVWNSTYDAGSELKPGGFARGSGSTPALLGEDFVAVTDNAEPQINLLIYPQDGKGNQKPICKLPLFQPGTSANDNGPVVHFDGTDYGVVLQNMYNEPPYLDAAKQQINGGNNNLTGMAPGITKVKVFGDGSGCKVDWSVPLRMTTLPVLSTSTGLLYGYVQDEELANKGEYIWYVTALDWGSGNTVWSVRAGAGGSFNDLYKNISFSPNGILYQILRKGVVMVEEAIGGYS